MSLMHANSQNSPKKVYISKLTTGDIKTVRTPCPEVLQCYYYADEEFIQSIPLVNLGTIQVSVTNTFTGESWFCMFDSSIETIHLLHVPRNSGIYEINYTTESGEVYTGTFQIE